MPSSTTSAPWACILLVVVAAAQAPATPAADQQPQPFATTVAAWLDSDGSKLVLKERATAALLHQDLRKEKSLAAEWPGLTWLGQRLRDSEAIDEAKDRRGKQLLRDLATDVMLGFIDEQRGSGMVFRGQYAPLQALQPFATERMFDLLLRTPDWFAETRRVHLVPAIADLQHDQPPPPVLLGITDLIENERIEPEDLRLSLSCLVWQWERKDYVEARAAKLRAASAEGDAEDRVLSLRQLADLWYRVRDYARAASTHAAMRSMATSSHVDLSPTDWYWAACYLSLSGRVDDGLRVLAQCADLLASPSIDSSHKLPRKLFEQDPEIAKLRADPRFQSIVERAFGPSGEPVKDR